MMLDLETMQWTHGRTYPIGRLSDYLGCPKCGTRHVLVLWISPPNATHQPASMNV
jgi:hypothetical protein